MVYTPGSSWKQREFHSRSFAEEQGDEGIKMRDEKEAVHDGTVLGLLVVNKLSAAEANLSSHYFLTHLPKRERYSLGISVITDSLEERTSHGEIMSKGTL
jgi:hypothetical protein